MAERNCLLLDSYLDKFYVVRQVWLFRSVCSVPYLRCSVQFWVFGLSSGICKLFNAIQYGQLLLRLVSVLGLDRCFQSDSLLYLVFSLYS